MDVINEKYFLEPEDKPEYHSNKTVYGNIEISFWNIPRLLWNCFVYWPINSSNFSNSNNKYNLGRWMWNFAFNIFGIEHNDELQILFL